MLRFDHVAVAAASLAEGVEWVETALGCSLAAGGQHPLMGTHNRLLGLGDLYLEVIAIDPDADAPKHPRWFDLDNFSGKPRLTNWVAGCESLSAALTQSPPNTGEPVSLARGDYRWQMAVPADGKLPFSSAFPALIQWHGALHPAKVLPDNGIRLAQFEVRHPEAEALRQALAPLINDPRIQISQGPAAMRASFTTPHGTRVLE